MKLHYLNTILFQVKDIYFKTTGVSYLLLWQIFYIFFLPPLVFCGVSSIINCFKCPHKCPFFFLHLISSHLYNKVQSNIACFTRNFFLMPHVQRELLTGLLRIKQKANSLFAKHNSRSYRNIFWCFLIRTNLNCYKNIKKP